MTALFQLAPLPLQGKDVSTNEIHPLGETRPSFFLPQLDDHISGSERLLASLRGTSRYELQRSPPGTPTKVIARPVLSQPESVRGEVYDEQDDDQGSTSIWQRVGEDGAGAEAGPSRQVFKPIQTWDYELQPNDATPFLSEKSVFAYDALLTSNESPIHTTNLRQTTPTLIHDSRSLLELMMRSTLSTVTTEHLKWNHKKARFIWGPEGGRPTGVGSITASSAIGRFLGIATGIRRLEVIIDTQSTLPLTPTHHALLHALSTYLTFVKQRLTTAIEGSKAESVASWNKWIFITKDVHQLVGTLCDVVGWPLTGSTALALPPRASALLTHLYSHLLASLSTASSSQQRSSTSLALAYLLSRSSGPFLSLLHAWVGLSDSSAQDEDIDPTSQPWSDLGITRAPLSSLDGGWEYTFSSRRMPGFIPKEDRRTLFEAGRSLRLLREASGGMHPLCSGDWGLEARWGWGDTSSRNTTDVRSHARRVNSEIEHWRRSTKDRTRHLSGSISAGKLRMSHSSRRERKRIPHDMFAQQEITKGDRINRPPRAGITTTTGETDIDQLWSMFNQPPGSHLDKAKARTPHLWAPTPLEELHTFIAHHSSPFHPLLPPDSPNLHIFISEHLLAPLLAHSALISTSLVSLYLDDLRLLDHLDVLRSFWLAGDVNFGERVSGALFGKEAAGAGEALGLGRRARTRARLGLAAEIDSGQTRFGSGTNRAERAIQDGDGEWGIGLGIGLSERAKWPPGGSELAYALRTTLIDEADRFRDRGPVFDEVEDRVSFAVKQLPEDEVSGRRARWMNPQAIEALDFLYLSYSPPSSIAILFPPTLMAKYQSIHNLILRVTRCEVVLKSMYWPVLHGSEAVDEPRKTGVDAEYEYGRPPSRAKSNGRASASASAAARLKHFRERQVITMFPPGSRVERRVQVLRFRMSHFVTSLSRYVVDMAIGGKWDTMRKRLERLKRRPPLSGSRDDQGDSRPASPSPSIYGLDDGDSDYLDYGDRDEHDGLDRSHSDEDELADGEGDFGSRQIHQLQSVHSLVLYHHLTLDRVLRACLLGPQAGQQVTYKLLTTLLGLVLDLAKVLVEVERGVKGWEDGKEVVESVEREWEEKERVFLHALERLSVRTSRDKASEDVQGDDTERDMKVLLAGAAPGAGAEDEDGEAGERRRGGGGREGVDDLKDLLVRLRFGIPDSTRRGRRGVEGGDWQS